MPTAIFCGAFDPVTNGHMDLIERASKLFDQLYVFVAPNSEKHQVFTAEKRLAWLEQACIPYKNVSCRIQKGLTVDAAKSVHAKYLIRGMRNSQDFEYELNMAAMNRSIDDSIETICLFTKPEHMFCSSSNVRELLRYHLDISAFVPDCVRMDLKGGYHENIE